MPRIDGDQIVAVVDLWLDVVVDRGVFRQRREHVERRQRARRRLNPRRLFGNGSWQYLESLKLALEDALVGAEHLLLVFLQRRRDEALAAGNRLLAVIVQRHRMEVRFRNFYVIAEHAIVADLQRVDAGARALARLHLRDDLFARAADRPQLVELAVDAVAGESAFAGECRRIVDERGIDAIADVDELVELGDERPHERRLQLRQHRAHTRHDHERLLQADEIARARRPERRARDEALEILNRLDRLAKLAALGRAKRELLDRVEAIANRLDRDERSQQPRTQHS